MKRSTGNFYDRYGSFPSSARGRTDSCRVANFSDKVVTLRSNPPVAEYHTVSGVSGSATPTENGGSPSAPNHPYCSVIERNIEDDKQESKIEKRAKFIQPSLDGPS